MIRSPSSSPPPPPSSSTQAPPDMIVGVEEEVNGELDRLRVHLFLILRVPTHWAAVGVGQLEMEYDLFEKLSP